jgi:superfamily I DNA/RNA helicase
VVFICSLNFDYKHDPFEPAAIPRNRADAYRNDAEKERQRAMDLNRHIVKEEEELRVIYTALTRTSKYSFITASKRDCMIPEYSIKHPHFETLQNQCENSHYVPFEEEKDKQFKEAYEKRIPSQKPKRNGQKNKSEKQNNDETKQK